MPLEPLLVIRQFCFGQNGAVDAFGQLQATWDILVTPNQKQNFSTGCEQNAFEFAF